MAEQTFHIKNFDRLQHYKDRSPPWIKLYNGLLDDYAFAHLPDACKAHLLAIGLLASRYSNKIPLDADWISKRINATETVDLKTLIESGFIIPDQECSTLLADSLQVAIPEREGETQLETEKRTTTAVVALDFETFFKEAPRALNRKAALQAYLTAVTKVAPETILAAAKQYAKQVHGFEDRFILSPAKWLEDERWTDFGPAKKSLTPALDAERERQLNGKAQ